MIRHEWIINDFLFAANVIAFSNKDYGAVGIPIDLMRAWHSILYGAVI